MNIKNFLLYTVVGGLFIVPVIPFIVSGGMFFPFITGKGFFFRILVEVLFGAYLLLALVDPIYRPRWSLITKSLGIFAIVILIADLLGENPYKSFWSNYERMEGFVLIAHLILYYIVATGVFKKVSDWTKWFNTSLLASLIVSIYSIAQLAGLVTINQGGVRVDATFGNATYLAIYLVFHIFLALFMISRSRKGSWQMWSYGILALLHTCILYFTATRGAILGLIGGLILTFIIFCFKEKENKYLRKISISALISIIAMVGAFFLIKDTSFVKQSPVLSRFASLSPSELKTQGRYFVWPMAIEGFKERPLLGWGQENFNYVFNENYNPGMYAQEQWFDRTHNIILDWLIAGGALGLLAYLSIYFAFIYCLWKKENQLSSKEKAIITGMVSAYVFHNMFVFDNLVSYIMFFSILGFVHTAYTENKKIESTKVLSENTYKYVVVPVVLVATVAVIYFINIPGIKTNKTLIKALTPYEVGGFEKNISFFRQALGYNSFGSDEVLEQLLQISSQVVSSNQVSDGAKDEMFYLAEETLLKKLERTPNDARYFVFAGGLFNRFGYHDLAIQYLDRAKELSPKKQTIYFETGAAYLAKGDVNGALDMFKEAYDLEPNSPESQVIYSLGGLYSNRSEIVNDMFEKLGEDKVIFENRILNAYVNIGDFQSVVAILQARIEREPENLQHTLSLASVYVDLGNKQEAINLINRVIELDPNFRSQGEQYIQQIQNM